MFQLGVTTPSKLVGQIPYWDSASNKDFDIYFDATRGGYKFKPNWGTALSGLVTDTHGSAIFTQDSAGGWVSYPANTLCESPLGLQTIPTRTNQVLNNTLDSGTGIGLTGTTMAPNTPGDSPAYDNNAKRVTQGSGAGDSLRREGLVCSADTTYTFSQSLKYDSSATWIRVVFSDNVSSGWQCWVNLQTKTFGTTSTFGSATFISGRIVLEPNGWFRIEITGKCSGAVAAGSMATIAVTADAVNTRAAGTYLLWVPTFELGSYASPPVITAGTIFSRDGTLSLITGLSTPLALGGVAGYVKFDTRVGIPEGRVLNFSDSGGSNQIQLKRFSDNTRWRLVCTNAGIAVGSKNTDVGAMGLVTLVFAYSNSYCNVRFVGETSTAATTPTGSMAFMDRLGIGNSGVDRAANTYSFFKKLGLRFGVQNQASFDAMYALALTA